MCTVHFCYACDIVVDAELMITRPLIDEKTGSVEVVYSYLDMS